MQEGRKKNGLTIAIAAVFVTIIVILAIEIVTTVPLFQGDTNKTTPPPDETTTIDQDSLPTFTAEQREAQVEVFKNEGIDAFKTKVAEDFAAQGITFDPTKQEHLDYLGVQDE